VIKKQAALLKAQQDILCGAEPEIEVFKTRHYRSLSRSLTVYAPRLNFGTVTANASAASSNAGHVANPDFVASSAVQLCKRKIPTSHDHW
jgi:hypothetical protein